MSSGVNRVTIIGNLGGKPEVRYTKSGQGVTNLRLACGERRKDGEQWVDHVEWVDVVVWGKTAENVGQYLDKGSQVYVEGRLQTREYNDKDGNKRRSTEVVASQVLFLGGKRGEQPVASGVSEGPAPASCCGAEDDADLPF